MCVFEIELNVEGQRVKHLLVSSEAPCFVGLLEALASRHWREPDDLPVDLRGQGGVCVCVCSS